MNSKMKFLSGSSLKMIALITMIIDHIGSVILRLIPEAAEPLFTVMSYDVSWYFISRMIGRIAFPIYCFLLVEGFVHTHNRKKYGLNIFAFAVISEIPWNLEHSGALTYDRQNVFFTLLLGYLGLCAYEKFSDKREVQAAAVLGLLLVSCFFRADYDASGFCFIMLMYFLREKRLQRAAAGSALLSFVPMILLSFGIIEMYNGKRGFIKGKIIKYLFYAAYPVHIFILYMIKLRYFGYG